MPVDSGIARIAARLGLAPTGAPPDKVQAALLDGVDEDEVYALHVHLIRLAREICRPREPLCGVCPVNDLCATFNRHRAAQRGG
jgi:endonuclease-3